MGLPRVFFGAMGIGYLVLAVPGFASAQVKITEIMVDPSGANEGRQWIEIANTGPSAVDLDGWKLTAQNQNHQLKFLSGTSTLPAQGAAVIVQKEDAFRGDYPLFNGTLIHSAFSLKSTEGTITINDASSTLVDSITYHCRNPCRDGNSLHRIGSSLQADTPTPGVYPDPIVAPKPILQNAGSKDSRVPGVPANSDSAIAAEKVSPQTATIIATETAQAALAQSIRPVSSAGFWQAFAALGFLIIIGAAGLTLGWQSAFGKDRGKIKTQTQRSEADDYEIRESKQFGNGP